MTEAFICDAVRTPIGRYGGSLSQVRADDPVAVRRQRLPGRPRAGGFHDRHPCPAGAARFSRSRPSKACQEFAKASTPSRCRRSASASTSMPSRLNSSITASE